MKRILFGVLARFLNIFIPVKKKRWVFSADLGQRYKEGSKYLLEYMLKEHPEYKSCFVTQNKSLYNTLKSVGIPCYYNYSFSGVLAITRAQCVFFTHSVNDLFYAFKKKDRHFYYLIHGQPLKIASLALKKKENYWDNLNAQNRITSRIRAFVHNFFISDTSVIDAEFTSACSDFLKPFLERDQDYKVPVKILGMPRNDILFNKEKMDKEPWLSGLTDKKVITYMPTHRLYGHGEVTPIPFINNLKAQDWLRERGYVFLMKQHPNMLAKIGGVPSNDVIIDISRETIDPQILIYHSDVLITDYSSVWIDYLLLKRPLIFYLYDDFEKNDAGCHYDITEDPAGFICHTEKELFESIKTIDDNYSESCPSDRIIRKFHKYVDAKSCERYYKTISSSLSV